MNAQKDIDRFSSREETTSEFSIGETADRIACLCHYIEKLALIGECDPDDAGAILGGIQSIAREAKKLSQDIELNKPAQFS